MLKSGRFRAPDKLLAILSTYTLAVGGGQMLGLCTRPRARLVASPKLVKIIRHYAHCEQNCFSTGELANTSARACALRARTRGW